MDKNEINAEFHRQNSEYSRLGKNLTEALKTFLTEEGIPFLDIYSRVKKFDSFYDKLEKKKYKNPFSDTEDICGIRIICYYTSDIEKINYIINKEFNVLTEQDKADLLGLKEFAYRSKHYIVKIKEEWLVTPNYRKLDNLKAEIQVRTVLMHAWAEIEHKLNYKSDAQVPDKFQRKLFRLSAKFEEADEQFEELRLGIEDYKVKLDENISSSKTFDLTQDFNIDSYKAFIKFYFPNDMSDDFTLSYSFEEYSKYGNGFKILDNALKKMQPYFDELIEDLINSGYRNKLDTTFSELIGLSMNIIDEETYQRKLNDVVTSWLKVVEKWRSKIYK